MLNFPYGLVSIGKVGSMEYAIVTGFVVAFIVLDIVSGFAKAVATKTISSAVVSNGLYKKLGYVLIMLLAYLCDAALNYYDFGITVPVFMAVCSYITFGEIVSVLENVSVINPNLPFAKFLAIFGIEDEYDEEESK